MLLRMRLPMRRDLRIRRAVRMLRVLRILLLIRKTTAFAIPAATTSAAAPAVPAFTLSTTTLPSLSALPATTVLWPSVLLRWNGKSDALLQHTADDLCGAACGGFVFGIS